MRGIQSRPDSESQTRHAHSERDSQAQSVFGEGSAVNVEAWGGRAHYIDGASEPYN